MRILLTKIGGLFLGCALLVTTTGNIPLKAAAVYNRTAKSHTEKDILKKTKKDISSFYVTDKHELRGFTNGTDGVQTVYKWTGKTWKDADKDPLRDFTYGVNKKKFSGYTTPSVNSKGTAYYIGSKTTVYKYNKKGKVTAKVNLKKKLQLNASSRYINQTVWLKKDLVAVDTWQMGGKSAGIYLVDLKKKKLVRSYSKTYTDLMAGRGAYIYLSSGDATQGTETIHKVNAVTGKCVRKLKTKELRALGSECTEEDDDFGLLRDAPLIACVYDGNFYVKYITGVYRWNVKKSRLDQIIDGSGNFGAGKLYRGMMQFTTKNKLYIIGYKTEDSSPSNLYEYTLTEKD
jgi:hypothetical protein